MESKDHLHALIQSMKKAEQSYFKKIKAAFGIVNSSLLQIFSILQNQDKYDEEEVLKKLEKDTFREFYSVKKHSLYNEILDVLVYGKTKSTEAMWQINKLISHAMILKERMLFEDAHRILLKAKKLTQDNEFFYKENEINQQLIEILNQHKSMTDFVFSETVESMRLNIIQNNEKSTNSEQFFILSDQLYRKGETLRLTTTESIKEEMRELYSSPLLADENKALSKTALVCYHFILYYKYNNYDINHEKARYHIKKLIDLQEDFKRFSARARTAQMGNYIILSLKAQEKDESRSMLARMKKMLDEQNDDFILTSYLAHKGIYLSVSGDMEQMDLFVDELENKYLPDLNDTSFSKEMMDIKHILFCYHFRQGNFKKAYLIASYLDIQFDLHSFKNLKLSEKLLKLLCTYEMNDVELMQSEIRAIKYMLKSLDNQLEIELHIFDTLERISKANNEQARNIILNQYLKTHSNNVSINKYSLLVNCFGFNEWVTSKVNKEEFSPNSYLPFSM